MTTIGVEAGILVAEYGCNYQRKNASSEERWLLTIARGKQSCVVGYIQCSWRWKSEWKVKTGILSGQDILYAVERDRRKFLDETKREEMSPDPWGQQLNYCNGQVDARGSWHPLIDSHELECLPPIEALDFTRIHSAFTSLAFQKQGALATGDSPAPNYACKMPPVCFS
jgi:hypothetical protein